MIVFTNLENKVHDLLEHYFKLISNRFLLLQGKFFPKVSVMQNILDINPEKKLPLQKKILNWSLNFHLQNFYNRSIVS